jgi:D-alanyl-lipoteichoic acid acyltransferase DltB (MBOAT superfamily)
MTNFLNSLFYNQFDPVVYTSVLFILLFTIFYGAYIAVFNDIKKRNILLLIFSLYFYYKISGFYVLLLVFMATSDYLIGKQMFKVAKQSSKKRLLILSLLINLGSLIFFKYTNFVLNSIFGIIENQQSPYILNLIMPLGISFYVFKTLSYIFDIYRETIEEPERNYINYLVYVSFFPNILAGPISKARDLLPQISGKLNINNELISKGLLLIIFGAFKKIFIADMLAANFVDRVFDSPEFFSGFEGLMATYGYTMQIYFDFSGYTDIVIGIAALLGFSVLPNFNKPFLAQNVSDFWRRWHMTLSGWLNEYVFYPLSYYFRRYKGLGVIAAVILTFFISGVWHGPSWNYILWGLSHGLAIAFTFSTGDMRGRISKALPGWLYKFISIVITFHFLAFSMVLFRASDLNSAWKIYSLIFTKLDFSVAVQWIVLYYKPFIILILAFVLHYTPMKLNNIITLRFTKFDWVLKSIIIFISILIIYQAFNSSAQPFIYLEF